jgi:hypothetical protein
MVVAVTLLALVCYGLAIFLWWNQNRPIFVFVLISGHIAALASPFWPIIYSFSYQADMTPLFSVLGRPVPTMIFFASAWFYTLPVLVVLYLYFMHWWRPGYLTALITFGGFLFYHTVMESLGLRLDLWSYASTITLPFGLSNALISALVAALISLLLLYGTLLARRLPWMSMFVVLLPATLLSSVLVRGLLGAPLWISLVMDVQDWMLTIGVISTLALLAWGIHIVAWGLSKIEWELV